MLGRPVSDLIDAAIKTQQQPNDAQAHLLLKRAVTAICEAQRARESYGEEIAKARVQYGNERCQIYEDADVSEGNDGVWVNAWVWVDCTDKAAE